MSTPDDPQERPEDESAVLPDVKDGKFHALLEKLSAEYHFDFREYKENSLARRIRARMAHLRIEDWGTYSQYLTLHPDEHVALFNTILINVTAFFRDAEAWKGLGDAVLPRLVSEAAESRAIRVWTAGCSSGEETYSIAMLLAEQLGDRAPDFIVKIYGTDIDEEALTAARQALYRADAVKNVPANLLDRYFVRDGQMYRFRRDLRRWCIFGSHNLTQAPPLSHIDLVVCRNVLIYFGGDLQERVLARFHYALREGGFLFLGRSESLLARSRLFHPINLKWRIFQRTSALTAPATLTAPARDETAAAGTPATRADYSAVRGQRVVEALPSAVFVIDPGDTILSWNPAAAMLYDIPTENALGRKFRDLDISYRVEGLRARVEDVKSRQVSARMEGVGFMRRSGEAIYADITIVPLLEGLRLIGVLVAGVDATEHSRLKEQMTRIAEQHATAIEELQSTNEELETTNEELQSTNEELETTNEEMQSTNEELETTVEELQAVNAELVAVNSELEAKTAELRRADESHQAILDGIDDAVVVVDPRFVVKAWNHAAERLWGLPADRAIGRDFSALPAGELTRALEGPMRRVAGAGNPVTVRDVPCTPGDGAARRVTVTVAALRAPSGDGLGVIAVAAADASASA